MAKRKRNPARDDTAFELSHIHNTCICMYPKARLMHIRNSVSKHQRSAGYPDWPDSSRVVLLHPKNAPMVYYNNTPAPNVSNAIESIAIHAAVQSARGMVTAAAIPDLVDVAPA